MKKEEIKSILKQTGMPIHDDGPTVIVIRKNKKQIPIKVIRKNNCIEASAGKIIKRTVRIPVDEIE